MWVSYLPKNHRFWSKSSNVSKSSDFFWSLKLTDLINPLCDSCLEIPKRSLTSHFFESQAFVHYFVVNFWRRSIWVAFCVSLLYPTWYCKIYFFTAHSPTTAAVADMVLEYSCRFQIESVRVWIRVRTRLVRINVNNTFILISSKRPNCFSEKKIDLIPNAYL